RVQSPVHGKTGRRLGLRGGYRWASAWHKRAGGIQDHNRRGGGRMTKSIQAALALAATAMFASACSEAPEQAEIAPDAPSGIALANGRLMLPAVAGNPGAVYFDVSNSSDRNMVIRAVAVEGAGSAMNQPAAMEELCQVRSRPDEAVRFAPGEQDGRAMDLADAGRAGGESEVTVTFVGGDKASRP